MEQASIAIVYKCKSDAQKNMREKKPNRGEKNCDSLECMIMLVHVTDLPLLLQVYGELPDLMSPILTALLQLHRQLHRTRQQETFNAV